MFEIDGQILTMDAEAVRRAAEAGAVEADRAFGAFRMFAHVVVDDGAARALTEQNRSLLPAGIAAVKGKFERGAIVSIASNGGDRLACGITNYSSKDVDRIKGLRSDQIQSILGYHYGQEVIHRNNLVLL